MTEYHSFCDYLASLVREHGGVTTTIASLADGLQDDTRSMGSIRSALEHMVRLGVLALDGDTLIAGTASIPPDLTAPVANKPGREIRFTPPAERYARWQASAEAAGVPLTIWVQLAADGVLSEKKADAPKPVQSTAQDASLWSRIHAIVGNVPISRAKHVSGDGPTVWTVRALAKKLGVEEKSIYAALHSRMASKRMVRVGDEYLPKGE